MEPKFALLLLQQFLMDCLETLYARSTSRVDVLKILTVQLTSQSAEFCALGCMYVAAYSITFSIFRTS